MDPIDLEIRKRLEKLKEPIQLPSEDELHAKLKVLRGLPTTSSSICNKYVLLPKPQSDTEQVDNLMKKFTDEIALQGNYDSNSASITYEIEQRLRKLKANDHSNRESQSVRVQTPESDTKILLKKILAEASLEKKTELQFPHLVPQFGSGKSEKEERMEYSSIEDEFCTICDRYPKWICLDCDEHGFCARCFNEYHEEIGEHHRKKPYMRQRRQSVDSDEYSD